LYQVSDFLYLRHSCDKNLTNIQTASLQFSFAELSFASVPTAPNDQQRLGSCGQISIEILGLSTHRHLISEAQPERRTSTGKNFQTSRIHIDTSNADGDDENPPNNTASVEDGGDPCIVCMERPPDSILLECGHAGLCVGCATVLWDQARRCPLCRQEFAAIMRIVAREAPRTVRAL
jgi:hypothetical protein